jgi:hypothetical protein
VSIAVAQKKPIPELDYVNATELTMLGKLCKTTNPYHRVEVSSVEGISTTEANLLKMSSGLAIAFKTNSKIVYVKAQYSPISRWQPVAPLTSTTGFNLFIKNTKGEWTWASSNAHKVVPAPENLEKMTAPLRIVTGMAEGEKECMVYLPAYVHIKSLEIGVDEGSMIKAAPSPFKHKIVFVGSSLTHGEGAPRPGANYVAQLGRRLNAETPNLGHSGQCKLQQHFVDIVCDNKADAFVFDAFSNPTADIINERLYDFVKQIRAKHKKIPLIFLQTVRRTGAMFDLVAKKRNDDQRAAAEKMMEKVCKDFKNVYFISNAFDTGADNEGTVDNSHLTDYGIYRVLQIMEPQLREILFRHNIK